MIFSRRDRQRPGRFTLLRVALFFAAAGTWLGGVMVGNQRVTAAALGLVALAVILGLFDRSPRSSAEDSSPQEE